MDGPVGHRGIFGDSFDPRHVRDPGIIHIVFNQGITNEIAACYDESREKKEEKRKNTMKMTTCCLQDGSYPL
jgi:hypothetical protein